MTELDFTAFVGFWRIVIKLSVLAYIPNAVDLSNGVISSEVNDFSKATSSPDVVISILPDHEVTSGINALFDIPILPEISSTSSIADLTLPSSSVQHSMTELTLLRSLLDVPTCMLDLLKINESAVFE